MEEVVIKASKDLRTKDELITTWKEKYQHIEAKFQEIKKDSEQKIEELENDMEKILQEKKESDMKNKQDLANATKNIENLNKDLDHYSDLYKTCESNCNTHCKEKLLEANSNLKITNILGKISAQAQSINKAHQVIKKLNEENKSLATL